MKTVLQRVLRAQVSVDGEVVGKTGRGLTALVAIEKGDSMAQIKKMAEKIAMLRIFEDENGKMNKSLIDIGGGLLCVSNFTVAGDCSHGRRPSFTDAENPGPASEAFDRLADALREYGIDVQTGIFGADMQVDIINDGPVTLVIDV